MKKVTLKLTALVMLLGGAITVSHAQDKINVVTSAVPFLRISPDARSGGMGDVGIATAPDANASFANIARTPFATGGKLGLAVNYTPWLRDLSVNDVFLASVAGYYKIDDQQAISLGLRYFKLGSIQFTDASGSPLQQYNPREFAIDLGYSRKLSSKLGLGIAIRYISSNLAKGDFGGQTYKAGSSVAGDLHLYHHGVKENGQGFNWGLTLSNLGSKISYSSDATQKDFIPANLGFGVAYTKVFDEANKITFALDLNKLLVPTPPILTGADPSADSAALAKYRNRSVISSWPKSFADGVGASEEIQEINISVGAEYWYNNQFGFRAGYFYENPNKGNRKYFTVGAGIKYSVAALNFSYVFPTGSGVSRIPLSNTYRFGLVFDLMGDK